MRWRECRLRQFNKLRYFHWMRLIDMYYEDKKSNKISTKILDSDEFELMTAVVGWLVGFGFNGPLRQYFSLYRAVSQREGERGEKVDESKNVQTTPTRTYCTRNRPLPYCNQNCRTPRHWKFTQHHRTTR